MVAALTIHPRQADRQEPHAQTIPGEVVQLAGGDHPEQPPESRNSDDERDTHSGGIRAQHRLRRPAMLEELGDLQDGRPSDRGNGDQERERGGGVSAESRHEPPTIVEPDREMPGTGAID